MTSKFELNFFPRILFISLILVILPRLLFSAQTFSVAPGVFTFDLNKARSASLVLTNTGDERIRLSIRPVYYQIDSPSLQGGNHLVDDFNNKDDISKSIIVSPRIVVLGPGQKRHVRFAIRLKEELKEGDYRAHLLVQILEGKKTGNLQSIEGGEENSLSIQLSMKLQTAVAVYGRVGKSDTALEVTCSALSDQMLALQFTNKSVWNFRGWFGLFESEDQNAGDIEEVYRLINFRESTKTVNVEKAKQDNLIIKWGQTKQSLNEGMIRCPKIPDN